MRATSGGSEFSQLRVPLAGNGWSDKCCAEVPGWEEPHGMSDAINREVKLWPHKARHGDDFDTIDCRIEAHLVLEALEKKSFPIADEKAALGRFAANASARGPHGIHRDGISRCCCSKFAFCKGFCVGTIGSTRQSNC